MKVEIKINWTKTGDADPHRRVIEIEQEIPAVEIGPWTDLILAIPMPSGYSVWRIDVCLPGEHDCWTNDLIQAGLELARMEAEKKAAAEKMAQEKRDLRNAEHKIEHSRDICAWAAEQARCDSPSNGRYALDDAVEHARERLGDEAANLLEKNLEIIKDKWAADKRAAAKEKAEQEAAKEAAAAKRLTEIRQWADAHGSQRLRGQLDLGLDGWPLHLHERMDSDFGGLLDVELDNDGTDSDSDVINPTEAALDLAKQLAHRLVDLELAPDVATALKDSITIRRITFEADDDPDCYEQPEPDSAEYVIADCYRPGSDVFREYTIRIRVEG